jgi:aspartyl-tRNA synthetase
MTSIRKALNRITPNLKTDRSEKNGNGSTVAHSDAESNVSAPAGNGRTSSPETYKNPKSQSFPLSSSPRNSGIFTRGRDRRGSLHNHSHSPIRIVKEKLGLASDSSEDPGSPGGIDMGGPSKNQQKQFKKLAERDRKAEQAEEREKAIAEKAQHMEEKAKKEETAEQRARYGVLPVNMYGGTFKPTPRIKIENISEAQLGKEIVFRARIHAMRKMSSRLAFFLLRQGTRTIQGVLQAHGDVSKFFLFWAERLDIESIVLIKGIVQRPRSKEGEVTGASIHQWEVFVNSIFVEGKVTEHLPYTVYEGEISRQEVAQEGDTRQAISHRVRMSNRVIDLRTSASNSIFRIQSGLGRLFREYLDSHGFVEIHTPKLQGTATESGSSVFKVDYFGRPAFLAQSPQLAKQLAISSDFGRVYEVGAVFRAENSNTHRHLTEYTGLDLEMAIDEHYHEVLRMIDSTFKHIFKGIYAKYRHEIEAVKVQYPHEDLVWLENTPVLPFADAIKMLNETGWRDEHGKELPLDEDLGTRDEIQLGKVVKEKYKTDYYILDKFPVSARPFYAMPDQNNPKVTNGFDIFLRGQEILSGGQRVHDAETLIKQLEANDVDPQAMEEYLQGFEWGAPPHGGGGIGLERMLMLLLNLGDIRNASLFHRDPKSFPAKPPASQLRHPEASTLHPPWEGRDRVAAGIDFQPLESLIANYGDASNTSWLEPRTQLWRDPLTGAAVGYVPQDSFAITIGDPLCHSSQYAKTIAGYLRFLKRETNFKPLWLLVGDHAEEVLATRFNWRTFSVTAEQRVNPQANPAFHDVEIQKKIRHAEKEGVKLIDIPNGRPVPADLRAKLDARVKDWLANRKGKQVHLTNIHLWEDINHRQYHYAVDKSGAISALVVLAQLSAEHGWQVKYSLDFPGAPSGTIEHLIVHALRRLAADGCANCTFGGGATASFSPGHNMKGARVKMLSKAYATIVSELKLTNKSEFREKLGARDEPVYICYPPHGLGPMGVRAILAFFEDD